MENEQEKDQSAERTQKQIAKIADFCKDLPKDMKVIIVGAGHSGDESVLRIAHAATKIDKAMGIEIAGAKELLAADVNEDVLREIHLAREESLFLIIEEPDEIKHKEKMEDVYLSRSLYAPIKLNAEDRSIQYLVPEDTKKKKWEAGMFMNSGDGVVSSKSRNGSNKKYVKRKKAKNGRKRK